MRVTVRVRPGAGRTAVGGFSEYLVNQKDSPSPSFDLTPEALKRHEQNRREREKEWPKAERIIEDETQRFMADLHHRATAPTIRRLKARADEVKNEEITRLLNKLGNVDLKTRGEITAAFDRLVNKLLHPPLESLRDEAQQGAPHGLVEALKRLFRLD